MEKDKAFTPFVAAASKVPEFTLRATILGILLGVFFSVGNTYLGLKVGMTISASIPAAVLSMAILKALFRNVSVLENNIVQTIATVGEGVAAGVIFTIPALVILGEPLSNLKIFILSFLGGILGILFMVPMRRYIIVKEHGVLPFPEGTACAEILKAGAAKTRDAVVALWGILIGAVFRLIMGAFHLFDEVVDYVIGFFGETEFRLDVAPSLFGVGFIIGPRLAANTFAGGVLGWWVLIPLIKLFGAGKVQVFPGPDIISKLSALEIWSNYIRYIGVGTVAVGGIYSLIRIAPMIIKTIHVGVRELFAGFQREELPERTDRDLSMGWLILGPFLIILFLWLLPLHMNFFTILLLVILGYFFVAVTSITVGLVGSSSNPASGMVITTLLITGGIFTLLGWTERVYLLMAITMGAVVNVSICMASTTSQDLKTGYILGATPKWQQVTEIIGLILPSLLIGFVLVLLNKAYVFGSANLPAPQATLVAVVAKGVITGQLPVILVLIGAFIGVILMLLRTNILAFAIGLYLPLEISTALMAGGAVKWLIDHFAKRQKTKNERGIIAASGLVAGDACLGVVIALLTVLGFVNPSAPALLGPAFSLLFFLVLAGLLSFLSLKGKRR
jgi:putative OPT family oligopeptide transporter